MPDETHQQAHASVASKKSKKRLPSWMYEVGFSLSIGWGVYAATSDWKQGVGAGLVALFGGAVHRGGRYLEDR
jgi:hypothetical protein